MAGVFKKQHDKSFNLASDIVFEGALLSDTRAILITELIHYILYERQQIPLPVDQLKLRTYAPDSNSNRDTEVTQVKSKRHPAQNVVNRKAKVFLEDLSQMCENLKNSFRACPEIDQVAVLLGGTVVSPKESYVVKLPPPCPDADSLPLKSCKNTLFKQIISEDILGALKSSLSPSNVVILLSAPRSCPLSWFRPKHTASPQTGNVISFNFRCVYFVPICYDLSIAECDISNISGLEPHECTVCIAGEGEQCKSPSIACCDSEVDQVKGNDSCVTDKCHSESGEKFLGGPFISNLNNSDKEIETSNTLERFCEHKRLNYIFSSHKRKNASSITSSPLVTEENSKSDPVELCFSPTDKVYKDLVDSASYERKFYDYIWYQSPVMLKGFKDHIAHEH